MAANTMPAQLENFGERMVPETSDDATFWEHVYRYAFACRFVKRKRVLDIACGEGYGASALQGAGAAQVIAVDISEEVCSHARQKYGLDARIGTAEKIPLPDASVDVVVSFETIEHVANPLRFLDECGRVLVPGGRLVISTPNKGVYTRKGEPPNPFHCSEMTEEEFSSVLRSRFRRIKFYSQHPRHAPRLSLRVLAADATPWREDARFERIRRSAHFRLAPQTVYELTPEQRRCATHRISNMRQRPFVNTYGIGPRRRWDGEKPAYIVATATR